MTWAAFRSSRKRYTARPPAANAAARIAWDCLSQNGARDLLSMGLLDGLWMAELPEGGFDEVDAGWITSQTPRVLRQLASAIDRRAAQGRA